MGKKSRAQARRDAQAESDGAQKTNGAEGDVGEEPTSRSPAEPSKAAGDADAQPADEQGETASGADGDALTEAAEAAVPGATPCAEQPVQGAVKHADAAASATTPAGAQAKPRPHPDRDSAVSPLPALAHLSIEEREKDLASQVTGLNAKLVKSFNRISDLEDDLSEAHSRILAHTTRIAEMSKEREQYMYALNTGLLVEKAHVTSEMQRMMERVVDETAQRGKAESDKTRIEAELEELSAALFNEANKMVAVERLAKVHAEAKAEQLETSLRDTERMMSEQQTMLSEMQRRMEQGGGDEKGVVAAAPAAAAPPVPFAPRTVLTLDTVPYQEFLSFLEYLGSQRAQLKPYFRMHEEGRDWTTLPMDTSHLGTAVSPAPLSLTGSSAPVRHRDYPHLPATAENLVQVSSQGSVPFIRRIHEEDSEPCVRLHSAPGLNWITRRQANTALHDGNLVIEPLFPGGVVDDEARVRAEYGFYPPAACTLCGTPLVNLLPPTAEPGRTQPRRSLPSLLSSLRRGALHGETGEEVPEGEARLAALQATAALPVPTHCFRLSDQAPNRYLLCSQHCLHRMRSVCAFWSYVRTLERAMVLDRKQGFELLGRRNGVSVHEGQTPAQTAADGTNAHDAQSEGDAEGVNEFEDAEQGEQSQQSGEATQGGVDQEEKQGESGKVAEQDKAMQEDAEPPKAEEPATEQDEVADSSAEQAVADESTHSTEEPAAPPPLPTRRPSRPPSHPSIAERIPARHTPVVPRSVSLYDPPAELEWRDALWLEIMRMKESMWKARNAIDLDKSA